MHPKTLPSFWNDLGFEQYEGQDLANARTTFHWCFAGPDTNHAGIFPVSRNFTTDTGLPVEWLHRVMRDFPRAFSLDEASRQALLRNFIRHQFGEGDRLMTNNMRVPIVKALRASPLPLARTALALYPELLAATDRCGKPLVSPSEALGKPLASPSEALLPCAVANTSPEVDSDPINPASNPHLSVPHGTTASDIGGGLGKPLARAPAETDNRSSIQSSGADARAREVAIPTLAEVIAYGERCGVDRPTCEAFYAYHAARDWMSGHTELRHPLVLLPGYAAERRTVRGPRGSMRLDGETADDLRAALSTEKNPQKRAALEARLRGLGGAA